MAADRIVVAGVIGPSGVHSGEHSFLGAIDIREMGGKYN
jgi:hypothetical protein